MKKYPATILALAFLLLVAACKKEEVEPTDPIATGPNLIVYGLSTNNELVKFNANAPQTAISKTAISGLGSGERLLSIDFRPATGELYAVSSESKLYIINPSTAATRAVGMTAFTPAIAGSAVGIDFNPTVDRLRLVTSSGQNLRLNPETGAVAAVDGNVATSNAISGIAYSNSKAGASSTVLYDLDATTGKLFRQDPPNNGTLVEVGSLGITFSGQAAFDISYDNKSALLAAKVGTENAMYTLDVNTGKVTKIGVTATQLSDIAIPTEPVAYALDNAGGSLLIFNPDLPGTPVSKAITGLMMGETLLGIDFRPLNGQLYGLGSSSRLYTLNLSSGAATAVGTGSFSTMLDGTEFGFDFNPTVDKIRVVSNTGQNLRLNPVDGTLTAADGTLNPGTPAISAAAYTNSFAGATTTSLFVIDHSTDKLYLQSPPNNGTLTEVGALGIDVTNMNGFDIGSTRQKAYLIATVSGATKVYTLNTTTGAATAGAAFPSAVSGFSIGLGF